MANIYKNAQFDLDVTIVVDVYTCPSNSRAIIQNMVANVGSGNNAIKAFLYDNSATTTYQFAEHKAISAGDSKSVSDGSIVLEENDKLQLQAASADVFDGCAILEINRD